MINNLASISTVNVFQPCLSLFFATTPVTRPMRWKANETISALTARALTVLQGAAGVHNHIEEINHTTLETESADSDKKTQIKHLIVRKKRKSEKGKNVSDNSHWHPFRGRFAVERQDLGFLSGLCSVAAQLAPNVLAMLYPSGTFYGIYSFTRAHLNTSMLYELSRTIVSYAINGIPGTTVGALMTLPTHLTGRVDLYEAVIYDLLCSFVYVKGLIPKIAGEMKVAEVASLDNDVEVCDYQYLISLAIRSQTEERVNKIINSQSKDGSDFKLKPELAAVDWKLYWSDLSIVYSDLAIDFNITDTAIESALACNFFSKYLDKNLNLDPVTDSYLTQVTNSNAISVFTNSLNMLMLLNSKSITPQAVSEYSVKRIDAIFSEAFKTDKILFYTEEQLLEGFEITNVKACDYLVHQSPDDISYTVFEHKVTATLNKKLLKAEPVLASIVTNIGPFSPDISQNFDTSRTFAGGRVKAVSKIEGWKLVDHPLGRDFEVGASIALYDDKLYSELIDAIDVKKKLFPTHWSSFLISSNGYTTDEMHALISYAAHLRAGVFRFSGNGTGHSLSSFYLAEAGAKRMNINYEHFSFGITTEPCEVFLGVDIKKEPEERNAVNDEFHADGVFKYLALSSAPSFLMRPLYSTNTIITLDLPISYDTAEWQKYGVDLSTIPQISINSADLYGTVADYEVLMYNQQPFRDFILASHNRALEDLNFMNNLEIARAALTHAELESLSSHYKIAWVPTMNIGNLVMNRGFDIARSLIKSFRNHTSKLPSRIDLIVESELVNHFGNRANVFSYFEDKSWQFKKLLIRLLIVENIAYGYTKLDVSNTRSILALLADFSLATPSTDDLLSGLLESYESQGVWNDN